jgi:hypothetical protein
LGGVGGKYHSQSRPHNHNIRTFSTFSLQLPTKYFGHSSDSHRAKKENEGMKRKKAKEMTSLLKHTKYYTQNSNTT